MKNFLLLLTAILTLQLNAQISLLSADFNDCELPVDWTINKIGDGPDNYFFTDDPSTLNGNSDGSTIDGTCMLFIDDDGAGQNVDPLTIQFITPVFDATQFSTVRLSVDVHFREYEESSFTIYATDGTNITQIVSWDEGDGMGDQVSEFVRFTADLSFYASPTMQLIFEYDDFETWSWWAGFDNVEVIGTGTATNLILEDFNTCGLPTGWTSNIITGENDWQFGEVANENTASTSMNGTCFAYFDDDGLGQDAAFSTAFIASPVFDGTEFANFHVDFDVILRRYQDLENLTVGVFDGTDFNPVVSYFTDLGGPNFDEFIHETIDLSQFRSPQMQVMFLYDDGDTWGWWVGLDNIKISGEGAINDLCENAFDLQIGEPCLTGSNLTALFTGEEPNCANGSVGALWYRFEAQTSGLVEIKTNANFNDVVTVFEGDCTTLTAGICDNWDEYGFIGETTEFQAIAGQTYFIRVNGLEGDFGIARGDLCIELQQISQLPEQPENNLCENAIPLTIDDDCLNGNNFNATLNGQFPSTNDKSRADIWYSFQTNATNPIEVLTNADFSDVIAIYEGNCGNLSEFATNHNGSRILLENLIPNQTYYIQITGNFATVEGNVCMEIKEIELPTPPNDNCVDAMSMDLDGVCSTTTNLGANFSGIKPTCEAFATSDIWFEIVAPNSGSIKINSGADFAHVIAVYHGNCNDLEEVSCFNNPNICGDYVTAGPLIPGDTYYIQIATATDINEYSNGGNLCLKLLDGETSTPEPLDLEVEVNCVSDGIGELVINAIGGVTPYIYEGNTNGEVLATNSEYLVIVTDENGCQKSVSGIVNCGIQDCALAVTTAGTDVLCNAANNGTAEVMVENALGNVSIEWSNGATTQQLTNLQPGGYSVTVIDDSGCQSVSVVTVEEPSMLLAAAESTNENGYNANNGTVAANPTGGTLPYQFSWSNGSTSQAQSGLAPGIYTITITDANNCATEQTVEVNEFECTLTADFEKANVICFGENNGQASVVLENGTAPYIYEWSNGETEPSIENLAPGNYSVIATDDNGCPQTFSFTITQPQNLVANISSTGETSNDANDGTATANPNGGSGNYTYLWSNDETTQTITNLPPANYSVTVTDGNGCETVETITITAFDCALSADISQIQNTTCNNEDNGSIELNINNVNGNLTVTWSNDEITNEGFLDNLPAGNYSATVTDETECPFIINATIEEPPVLQANFTEIIPTDCAANAIGSATIEATGGTEPYEFSWSNGETGETQNNLETGEYIITITDQNECETLAFVNIEIIDDQNPIVSTQNLILELNENGEATISTEDVNNGSSDNCGIVNMTLSNTFYDCGDLGENEVTLFVEDENENLNSATAIITVVDNQIPTIECPEDIISTDCEGVVFYELPTAVDNCTVSNPVLISGLASGAIFPNGETTVGYVVTDFAGNTANCTFIVEITNPLVSEIEIEKVDCHGESTGAATAVITGGTGNYTYQWNDENNQTTATAINLPAGTYEVTATDENGCEIIATAVVTEPELLGIGITDVIYESSTNANDGAISVVGFGGTPPFELEWFFNGEFYSDEFNLINLTGGEYELIVTDGNGCTASSGIVTVETIVNTTELPTEVGTMSIFPNPNDGKFALNVDLNQTADLEIRVFDVVGKEVLNKNYDGIYREVLDFDLKDLAKGVYYFEVVFEDFVWGEKVVISK